MVTADLEALHEESQGSDTGQSDDGVTEHIVHNEPAAMSRPTDAGYRTARQQLIVDEE